MAINEIASEMRFKKDWIYDPPSDLYKQFEMRDLAKLAVIQLKAQHTVLKAHEEAIEEAIEVYTNYMK